MVLDGLQIAGIGVGMVFLSLVVILLATLTLRTIIGKLESFQVGRRQSCASPNTSHTADISLEELAATAEPIDPVAGESLPNDFEKDGSAKAAAIAVALYMATEEGRMR